MIPCYCFATKCSTCLGSLSSFILHLLTRSLYFGQVIDKIGSRSAMALAQGGTALAYFILASAFNVPLLFLSRVPTVFMACMLCAQGAHQFAFAVYFFKILS